jgi:hypothetical protein
MTTRSLYELYSISFMDLIMDNDRKQRKYSQAERKIREQLRAIEDQHEKWREHCLTTPRLQHHEGNDGDPTHTSREDWVEYVKRYRDDWWREWFGCYFNPMCACDTVERCGCRPFANGVTLIDGKTEIKGALSRELQAMYPVKPMKPSPPPPGYYSCPGCNVFLMEVCSKCPLCQTDKFSTNLNI